MSLDPIPITQVQRTNSLRLYTGSPSYLLQAVLHIYYRQSFIFTTGSPSYLLQAVRHIYYRQSFIFTTGSPSYLIQVLACNVVVIESKARLLISTLINAHLLLNGNLYIYAIS